MEDTLAEALATGMIVRVTRRVAGKRLIDVGQAWSLDQGILRIRELSARRYLELPVCQITNVEIIGVYSKDYGA